MKTIAPACLLGAALLAPCLATAADYAPIECAKAQAADELAICKTYELGQLDARMATLFQVTTGLVAMGQRGDLQDAQVAWIKHRQACKADLECLHAAYLRRIAELKKAFDGIAARGPF